jgi:hypothetical protein
MTEKLICGCRWDGVCKQETKKRWRFDCNMKDAKP